MLSIEYTNKMKRDVKRMIKRSKDISRLSITLELLANMEQMPAKYHDHPLKGEMFGFRECHIEPDWLLIYKIVQDKLILLAVSTGTHADLFDE